MTDIETSTKAIASKLNGVLGNARGDIKLAEVASTAVAMVEAVGGVNASRHRRSQRHNPWVEFRFEDKEVVASFTRTGRDSGRRLVLDGVVILGKCDSNGWTRRKMSELNDREWQLIHGS